MAELVVGRDEMHIHTIWLALKEHSWWYGNGAGIASLAISGIDIALWDLKGKVLGRSLLDLLGGPANAKMPAVARRSTAPKPRSPRWPRIFRATLPMACRA
jgi:L-alanine-DL-glutamate epimerase-like enolase superfamily enzyme